MTTTFLKVANNATSTLAKGVALAATEVELITGGHATFPTSTPFDISIDNEILHVTAIVGDVFTVTRAAQSTTEAEHAGGATVQLNVTAKSITDLNSAVNTLEGPVFYPESAEVALTENPTKNLVLPESTSVLLKASVNLTKLETIVAPASGGRLVQLVNNSANVIILVNAAGAPGNIISTWGGLIGEYALKAKQTVWLWYDAALKTWLTVPAPPASLAPVAGANGTITVGTPGIPRANLAVIVGDGVTLTWKVKHLLATAKMLVQFAEGAAAGTPIATPFQKEEYKSTENLFENEAGKALEAGKTIWVKMVVAA